VAATVLDNIQCFICLLHETTVLVFIHIISNFHSNTQHTEWHHNYYLFIQNYNTEKKHVTEMHTKVVNSLSTQRFHVACM